MFFASENNSYPLFYHHSPSYTNAILDNNNTFFHHHHHGKYNNNYLLQPTYPSISENPIVKLSSEPSIKQENTINYPSNMINPMSDTRRSTGKKDRHTKICTAQGIRDRRVRLSMSIAREFFNLQDMLGFDKASETLGWLLAKSKTAIDELTSTSNNNTVTPAEEWYQCENDGEYVDDEKNGINENSLSKKRKRRGVNHLKDQNLVEEVRREKARERARERTRKKKTIVDDHNNHHQQQHQLESLDHHHHHQIHQRVQQDLMICQSSSSATPNSIPTVSKGVNVGETVVIKDNKSRSFGNYYYEMMNSKDDQETGNHYNDCFNKSATEICNYSGIMQQPAGLFPALNIINLSTEIHINARPWDTYSNQILH